MAARKKARRSRKPAPMAVNVTTAAPYDGFWSDLARLKAHVPLCKPVSIAFNPTGPKLLGWCELDRKDGSFSIVIDPGHQRKMLQDTLIHEWAHARCADAGFVHSKHVHHGAEWGVMFAQCYRAVIENKP